MRIPNQARQAIRAIRHGRAIRRGTFGDPRDPLFQRLEDWVSPGDVVVDVGAAVGTFAIPLSAIVGPEGRVVAIEPMPDQFEALVRNTRWAAHPNITCMQMAASDAAGMVRMSAPIERGMPNWYQASIGEAGTPVFCAPLDSLPLPGPVSFLKVDAEGHDFAVLRSAAGIVERDRPVVFVEADDRDIADWLAARGYGAPIEDPASPNRVYTVAHHALPLM